jgi:amino acid transporter
MFQFNYPQNDLEAAGYPDPTLEFTPDVSPSVLVFCFLIILFLLNMLPVRQFGQMEYIFGLIKMLFIILMIILNVVLQIMQPVKHGPFWTYNAPYSFGSPGVPLPNGNYVGGGAGQLGGMFEAMTTCLFGMIGFETVAITAAENKDLRTEETMKIATRKIVLRIIILYTLATFTVGLNVPYNNNEIQDHLVISFGYGQNCAFLVSTVLNRMRHWPYFINDFIIFSATTAGTNGVYNASRTLHALASIPDAWPDWEPIQSFRRRLERTSYGVPHAAVICSWMFGFLGFLAGSSQSQAVSAAFIRSLQLLS